MLQGTTRGTETTTPETSSRLTAGAISTDREGVGTAAPAAEQIGQTWESIVGEVKSAQQCNCAARRMAPRSKNKTWGFFDSLGISRDFVSLKTSR
jgi:hypothetical protein